jgi:predicted Zn-dependent protease
MRKRETARRSVGLFRVIDPGLRHVGGLAARAAGLSLLRYSREDEDEADAISLRYVREGGWDTASVVRVFGVLVRLQQGAETPPPWLATHPDPAMRRDRMARALGISPEQPSAPEEGYLRAIDGLAFGDDPRDGFLAGTTFVQPRRGFQIELPNGWKTLHDKASVLAVSPDERAVFVLLETESKSPEEALKAFFADASISPGQRWDGSVGGFPLASSSFALVDEEGRTLTGLVAFVAFDGKVLALVAIGPEEGWAARADVLARTFASFARVDARLTKVQPMRVRLQLLDRPASIAELAKGGPVDARTLALVNQVEPDEPLAKGRAVKLVAPAKLGE